MTILYGHLRICSETPLSSKKKMPMDQILSDATAKAIVKQLKLTRKRVAEILGSVASIKVSTKKP